MSHGLSVAQGHFSFTQLGFGSVRRCVEDAAYGPPFGPTTDGGTLGRINPKPFLGLPSVSL